jgi:hypothetical protein
MSLEWRVLDARWETGVVSLLRAGFLCCVLVGQVGQGIVMFHVDET